MRPIPGNDNFDALAERAFREAVDRGILVDWPAHDPLFVGHFEYCQHDGHGTAWFCRTNPSAWGGDAARHSQRHPIAHP